MTYEQAVEKARKGEFTEAPEILRLANEDSWAVAHEQAENGWTTKDPETLKLAADNGWTVADVIKTIQQKKREA